MSDTKKSSFVVPAVQSRNGPLSPKHVVVTPTKSLPTLSALQKPTLVKQHVQVQTDHHQEPCMQCKSHERKYDELIQTEKQISDKHVRKIMDLELTNQSLVHLNKSLEAQLEQSRTQLLQVNSTLSHPLRSSMSFQSGLESVGDECVVDDDDDDQLVNDEILRMDEVIRKVQLMIQTGSNALKPHSRMA